MNWTFVVGLLLVLSPIIGLGLYIIDDGGWEAFFAVFGITLLVTAIVSGGAYLMCLSGILPTN